MHAHTTCMTPGNKQLCVMHIEQAWRNVQSMTNSMRVCCCAECHDACLLTQLSLRGRFVYAQRTDKVYKRIQVRGPGGNKWTKNLSFHFANFAFICFWERGNTCSEDAWANVAVMRLPVNSYGSTVAVHTNRNAGQTGTATYVYLPSKLESVISNRCIGSNEAI